MTKDRRTKILIALASVALIVSLTATGIVIFGLAKTHGAAGSEHHGMSPASWIAIFSPLWIIMIGSAARRQRARADAENAAVMDKDAEQ